MRFSLLFLLVGCSVLRDADDFQVGDAGVGVDAAPDGSTDASECTEDRECGLGFANAAPRCVAGLCVLGTCEDGFASCDDDDGTGCEREIYDDDNCGGCGVVCGGDTPLCDINGTNAACTDRCSSDRVQCGESCVNTEDNVNHCGDCDDVCLAPDATASAACDGGICGFICAEGRGDCDRVPANTCEIDITNDVEHCGDCNEPCDGERALGYICDDAVCRVVACEPGFADCDGDGANGCEVALGDPSNCGSCGDICGAPSSCQDRACVRVAVSQGHSCTLRPSGAIDCWGRNESRQIRDDQSPLEAPYRLTWSTSGEEIRAHDVAVGINHTCFIARSEDEDLDGTLYCQGTNGSSQGARTDGLANYPPQPVQLREAPAGDVKFRALSSRDSHSCAIDRTGGLWCWGIDVTGQLGPRASGNRFAQPVAMPGGLQVRQVVTSIGSTCALLSDGTVACFGRNADGELGRGTSGAPAPNPERVITTDGIMPLDDVESIAAGTNEFCAVRAETRELVCWGANINSTIETAGNIVPTPLVVDTGVDEVFMFHLATCWSKAAETWCRGREIEGYFGDGPQNVIYDVNTRMVSLDGFYGAAGGYRGACGYSSDTILQCWGWSAYGEVPRETLVEEVPSTVVDASDMPIFGLRNVVSTLEGSCGIRTTGGGEVAVCWGGGGRSTSGDGTNLSPPTPQVVPGLTNVVDIARGGSSVCAINMGELGVNQLFCWGSPNSGSSAGAGSASTPTLATGVVDPLSLDMGNRHGCAVLRDSTVRCWGYSANGETGIVVGSTAPRTVEFEGTPISAVQVVTGFDYSCALLTGPGGNVMCWGANSSGQLGRGSTTMREEPGLAMTDIVLALDAGYQHVCSILGDGSVSCWGSNTSGQLGGAGPGPHTPVFDVGRTAVSVAAGGRSSCAVLNDGTVVCWGDNTFRQLGTPGPSTSMPRPVTGLGMTAAVISNSSDLAFSNCAGNAAGGWQCWGLNSSGRLGTTPNLFFSPTLIEGSAP